MDYKQLDAFNSELITAINTVDKKYIIETIQIILSAYNTDRTIYIVGNGGSASTAAHFAADLSKFATNSKGGFRAFDLVSNYSLHTAWTNDNCWEETWSSILNNIIRENDIIILFSVNGGGDFSNNLVKLVEIANEKRAITIGFAGGGGGVFSSKCHIPIIVPIQNNELKTPVVESIHVCLHHLICNEIRKAI
jgi:D-sedoheptulose 7-phosphate isomerase